MALSLTAYSSGKVLPRLAAFLLAGVILSACTPEVWEQYQTGIYPASAGSLNPPPYYFLGIKLYF
jgi:hypothetical protein